MLGANAAVTVASITPAVGVAGEVIKITGTGFTAATRVLWRGKYFHSNTNSESEIQILLPNIDTGEDMSGPVTVIREDNAQVTFSGDLTYQALPQAVSLSATSAREGDQVRMDGKYLMPALIKTIAMGDMEFLPVGQNGGTSLWFNVPKGAPSGSVVLVDWRGHRISAGVLNVIPPTPSIEIASVQISQGPLFTVSDPAMDPNFRLVSQRDLLVRVRLKPAASLGQIKPDVQIGFRNAAKAVQAPAQMQGPATLATSAVAENDIANSYTYTIPGEWLDKGFSFTIRVADNRYPDATKFFTYQPPASALGGGTYVRMHVVPTVMANGVKAKVDVEHFKRELMAVYPLSAVDVVVEPEFRWPVSNPSQNDILNLLSSMSALRASSQGKSYDFFIGVMPCSCSSVAQGYGRAAVVADTWSGTNANAVTQVMMHEIGHTFGRMHTWDDTNSPYKNGGVIGTGPWLPEVGSDYALSFVNPASRYDIMSYDVPDAVSAYTFAGAYSYLEPNLPLSARPALLRSALPAAAALFINGRVDLSSGAVTLQAPMDVRAMPDTVALAPDSVSGSDDYVLELKTEKAGYRYPLQLKKLITEHREDLISSFELTVAPAEPVVRARVWRGSKLLLDQAAAPSL